MYRSKAVAVDAFRVEADWFDHYGNMERRLHLAGVVFDPFQRCVTVPTNTGIVKARIGDWIVGRAEFIHVYTDKEFRFIYEEVRHD